MEIIYTGHGWAESSERGRTLEQGLVTRGWPPPRTGRTKGPQGICCGYRRERATVTVAEVAVVQLLLESQITEKRKETIVPLPLSVCSLPAPPGTEAEGAFGQGEPG